MSNLNGLAKQRFSRRQVTKRTFKIGGDLGEKQDVTPTQDRRSLKRVRQVDVTPPGLQDTSCIGDVSVSFLASTPKPGKTQFSRRRPLSALHESKISKTNQCQDKPKSQAADLRNTSTVHLQSSQNVSQKLSKTNNKTQNYDKSFQNNGSDKTLPKTSSSSEMSNTYGTHISKSSSVNKSKNILSNVTTSSLSNSGTKLVKSAEVNSSQRKRKLYDTRHESVIEKNSDRPQQNSEKKKTHDIERFFTSTRRSNDQVTTTKKRKVSTSDSLLINPSTNSSNTGGLTREKNLQKPQNNKKKEIIHEKRLLKSRKDETTKNKRESLMKTKSSEMKSDPATSRKNSMKQTNKTITEEEEEDTQVHTVTVLQDGSNRKKSDLLDLDVALSKLTETIESHIDVCESQKEKQAVKRLEMYLIQDISEKIDVMQRVKKLQDKIRTRTSTLKERKKHLMSLQIEKSELLVGKRGFEDQRQSADNMKEINHFLNDMQSLISQS